MVLCFGCGTAMVVRLNSGPSRMGSWFTCLIHPSVWMSLVVIRLMETGWAFGIASTDKSRSSGVGTLSGAQSTCQAAAQHLMQPSVPKSVVKIREIHLKFGIAPSNHNKSGQLVRQMPQLLLSEACVFLISGSMLLASRLC